MLLIAAGALVLGGVGGYLIFRYVIKGKYKEMIDTAEKQADVIKEKKLLEVKEKFPVCPWKAFWGDRKGRGSIISRCIGDHMHLQASVVRSVLTKSCACILGKVLGPVSYEKRNKITAQR